MDLITAFFVYLLIWWMTLFMVLPFGVARHAEGKKGHDAGAPLRAEIGKKLLINSALAGVILAVIIVLDRVGVIRWHAWFDNGEWR